MTAVLEVWARAGRTVVPLGNDRITLGAGVGNDIAIDDPAVSDLHAAIERYAAGWCIQDLGSRNGTLVNGDRVLGTHRLRDGDDLRLGGTRLIFAETGVTGRITSAADAPPRLTPREGDVLLELCRPLLAGDQFTAPPSTRAVAQALVVTEAAVKHHLANLYAKFDVVDDGLANRRVALANEALRRGAVTLSDLRPS